MLAENIALFNRRQAGQQNRSHAQRAAGSPFGLAFCRVVGIDRNKAVGRTAEFKRQRRVLRPLGKVGHHRQKRLARLKIGNKNRLAVKRLTGNPAGARCTLGVVADPDANIIFVALDRIFSLQPLNFVQQTAVTTDKLDPEMLLVLRFNLDFDCPTIHRI